MINESRSPRLSTIQDTWNKTLKDIPKEDQNKKGYLLHLLDLYYQLIGKDLEFRLHFAIDYAEDINDKQTTYLESEVKTMFKNDILKQLGWSGWSLHRDTILERNWWHHFASTDTRKYLNNLLGLYMTYAPLNIRLQQLLNKVTNRPFDSSFDAGRAIKELRDDVGRKLKDAKKKEMGLLRGLVQKVDNYKPKNEHLQQANDRWEQTFLNGTSVPGDQTKQYVNDLIVLNALIDSSLISQSNLAEIRNKSVTLEEPRGV